MPAYDDNDPAWPPRCRGFLEGTATTEEFVRRRIAADLPPVAWFKAILQHYEGETNRRPMDIPCTLGDLRDLAEFIYGIEGVTDGSNPEVQD